MRIPALLAAGVLAAAVATGCGGDDDSDTAAGDGGPQTLRVTSLPILDAAPYFWALDTGLFEEHGLNIRDQTSAGGAADLPALVSDELDLVYSNTVSALLARQKGLPITYVSGMNENRPESLSDEDFSAMVAAPDSDVTSAADLEGKRLAVNTLENINHLFERAWLESEGVDPDSVEFLEIPFPDQPVALERNRVDATMIGAPFLQQLQQAGAETLGFPYRVLPKVTVSGFIGTDQFAEENAEAAQAFREALAEAIEQVNDPANRDRLFEILEERTKVERAIIEDAALSVFTTDVDADALSDVADLMVSHGMVDEVPDLDAMVVEQ